MIRLCDTVALACAPSARDDLVEPSFLLCWSRSYARVDPKRWRPKSVARLLLRRVRPTLWDRPLVRWLTSALVGQPSRRGRFLPCSFAHWLLFPHLPLFLFREGRSEEGESTLSTCVCLVRSQVSGLTCLFVCRAVLGHPGLALDNQIIPLCRGAIHCH